MKISIVIPFYGKWELCHCRLSELWAHSLQKHKDTEIVLVNDCSPKPEEFEGAVTWWQQPDILGGRLRYYSAKENKGFGGSMNKGAKIAINHGAEGIILLSNDVTVMGDIVKDVDTLLSLEKSIVIGGEVLYNDTGWNVLEGCGVVPYANGWFLATSKEAWGILGGFDPVYSFFDYEDVDLSTTAHYHGIKLVTIGTKLRHAGGQTIKDLPVKRMSQTLKNQLIWQAKWAGRAEELKEKIYGKHS